MIIALLADLHANLPALLAVENDFRQQGVEQIWLLGDVIGYGPRPVETLLWVKKNVHYNHWVLGNHDASLAGLVSSDDEQSIAEAANVLLKIHKNEIDHHPEAHDFFHSAYTKERIQPLFFFQGDVNYLGIHASKVDLIFSYVYAWQKEINIPREFDISFEQLKTNGHPWVLCFGHTHVPTLVSAQIDGSSYIFDSIKVFPFIPYKLSGKMTLLNPGSVGQPRDLDRRASYVLLDTSSQMVTFRRVAYDWGVTLEMLNEYRMRKDLIDLVGLVKLDRAIGMLEARLMEASCYSETPEEWKQHYKKALEKKE